MVVQNKSNIETHSINIKRSNLQTYFHAVPVILKIKHYYENTITNKSVSNS